MSNANETTNAIIKNVELYWAKLNPSKPVSPFGEEQWEIQIRFPKKRVAEMEQYGSVKEVPDQKGVYQLNLKKKAIKKDGSKAQPIEVVGTTAGSVINPTTIGNGSVGNIKVMLRDYQIKSPKGVVTKEGTQVTLTKVQVTNLIKYEPKGNDDFDFDDEDDSDSDGDDDNQPVPEKKAAAPAKGKPGRKPAKVNDMEDDIPF